MSDLGERIANSYCRAYISQHYEGWDPRIFEHYDLNEYLDTLERLDSDVVIVTSRTHNGYWFTDLGTGTMHPGLHGVDQLQEAIKYFRPRNKLIVTYFSTVYDKELFDLHPEWQQVDPNGRPLGGGSFSKVVCMNSPYREYVLFMVETLFRKRDLDGILIDMPFFEEKVCYCESCKRSYRAMYNRNLPEREDHDDENYRLYLKARRQANMTFTKELIDRIKSVKPDALCYMQFDLLKVGQRNSQNYEMARLGDYVYSDLYFEFGTIQTSVATKIQSLLSKYPPEIGIMTRPGTHNDTPNMQPLDQIRSEVFTILANGGAIHLFDIMWPDGTLQKDMWDRNAQVFREIRQRTPWLGGRSQAQVAVYHSEKNYIAYGRNEVSTKVTAGLFGACRALLEAHIPFDVLPELDAGNLDGYDALVLPNVACLSDAECARIRAFVQNGGGLVCSNQTSMFDEQGRARMAFALGDVLGIRYTGSDTAAYSRVYAKFDMESELAAGLPSDGHLTSWGVSPKVEAETACVLARIKYPYCEPTGAVFINIMANPPAVESTWPAATENLYGKGRAVYFAGQPEKDFVSLSFPELKVVIANAVRRVLRAPEKVRVDEAQPLEVTLYKNRRNQTVIHLVNQLFDYGRTINSKAAWSHEREVKTALFSRNIIQHVYPLSNVKVSFRADGEVSALTLQPSGVKLHFTQKDGVVEVVVPEIRYHEMIVVEAEIAKGE